MQGENDKEKTQTSRAIANFFFHASERKENFREDVPVACKTTAVRSIISNMHLKRQRFTWTAICEESLALIRNDRWI
uniref:Uncharacterized protein n=1 Tax=Ditylenchus dipsaci TaxID=166011 RepID=A0A915DN30_9BILA